MTHYFEQEDENVCKQPEWTTYENVTFENSSYRYVSNQFDRYTHTQSKHYMYLQSISIDQSQPAVSTSLDKYTDPLTLIPKLSFKYYSSQVESLTITHDGIGMHGDGYLGYIEAFIPNNINPVFQILDE
ncbi:unnamed protein product, partial [Schistosoma curassoni]|uniref:Alpha-carbonic anhydrase domain-containing protein n=1 Tax=Schistosoma curassoni TaxID=6186 RepID=A0A183JSS2_9TREM